MLRCDFLAGKLFDCILSPERNIKVSMVFALDTLRSGNDDG